MRSNQCGHPHQPHSPNQRHLFNHIFLSCSITKQRTSRWLICISHVPVSPRDWHHHQDITTCKVTLVETLSSLKLKHKRTNSTSTPYMRSCGLVLLGIRDVGVMVIPIIRTALRHIFPSTGTSNATRLESDVIDLLAESPKNRTKHRNMIAATVWLSTGNFIQQTSVKVGVGLDVCCRVIQALWTVGNWQLTEQRRTIRSSTAK